MSDVGLSEGLYGWTFSILNASDMGRAAKKNNTDLTSTHIYHSSRSFLELCARFAGGSWGVVSI